MRFRSIKESSQEELTALQFCIFPHFFEGFRVPNPHPSSPIDYGSATLPNGSNCGYHSILAFSHHLAVVFPKYFNLFILHIMYKNSGSGQFSVHGKYWMIYRGPGFLAFVWFGSSPTPSPPFSSVNSKATHRKTEKDRQLANDRGGGKGGGRGAES